MQNEKISNSNKKENITNYLNEAEELVNGKRFKAVEQRVDKDKINSGGVIKENIMSHFIKAERLNKMRVNVFDHIPDKTKIKGLEEPALKCIMVPDKMSKKIMEYKKPKITSRPLIEKRNESTRVIHSTRRITPEFQVSDDDRLDYSKIKIDPSKLLDHEKEGYSENDESETEMEVKVDEHDIKKSKLGKEMYLGMLDSENFYLVNNEYVSHQKWGWDVREREVNRMLKAHSSMMLRGEVIYDAVNMFDRVCGARAISEDKLDLLSVTCLFIATKFAKIGYVDPVKFLSYAVKPYSISSLTATEVHVLFQLDFRLIYPNPLEFLGYMIAGDDDPDYTKLMTRYIMEMTLTNHTFLKCRPSLLAASAMHLSRLVLGRFGWDDVLIEHTGFQRHQLKGIIRVLINNIDASPKDSYPDQKYGNVDYGSVSIYFREWLKGHSASDISNIDFTQTE
ncbi:cyclin-like protein [Neoconidiobolus thromboides FSU 785]|nr:cyclin-like protein [Neoconidiobolus thromboides FSU 785]